MDVDVVVCAKNRARSLNEVLTQIVSYIPFTNLIIVYGTSVDKTKDTALKYTEKVFWDEDKGLGAARNLGVRKASSEIVAMIDSDIILTKGWYQKLVRNFEDPKVAAVMGNCILGYGCSPLQKLWEYKHSYLQEDWGCNNVLLRRDIVIKIGNFNETIKGAGEDYDLFLRLKAAGYKWIWDKEVTVYHPSNMLEHLKHCVWWAEGMASLSKEQPISPLKLMIKIFTAIKDGLTYIRFHPTLCLYVPLADTLWQLVDFKNRRTSARNS